MVERERSLEAFRCLVTGGEQRAGVVGQNVDALVALAKLLHQGSDLRHEGQIRDVLMDRYSSTRGRCRCRHGADPFRLATHEGNLDTAFGQLNRGGSADAASCPREHDQRHRADSTRLDPIDMLPGNGPLRDAVDDRVSDARELLGLGTGPVGLNIDAVADAVDACADAAQACTSCADLSLAEDDVDRMKTCIALCASCADVCTVTARALSRSSQADQLEVHDLLRACVRACTRCAEECARHAEHHRHCAICARSCRACERSCAVLLQEEAFEALEKLAGG
jgi:hypothetical protein